MAQKALNLEDIVAGNVIQTKGIGSMTWLKDGERYSRLENNKQTGGTDIVAYQAKDNSREVIIPSSLLTDKSTGKPIPARSISWSADNEKVLIYNNTQRVWRYDTRGDYWVLNLKDGALRQLGKGMPESSMMFAKFSPDGTRGKPLRHRGDPRSRRGQRGRRSAAHAGRQTDPGGAAGGGLTG